MAIEGKGAEAFYIGATAVTSTPRYIWHCQIFEKPNILPARQEEKARHLYKESIMKLSRAFAVAPLAAAIAAIAPNAHATNGMNLEGYGPIPLSMGGAAMAYENGLGAMMNNPATLALMPEGQQVSVALHFLGPDVATTMGTTADSDGDAYFMPAIGWGRKSGAWTYGIGMFAQGGMGTEYSATSPVAMGTGEPVRSELGVGRVIFPLAYQVSPNLAIGGTLDFVWAGLDMRAALAPAGPRIDFSDDSDFTGKAKGYGFAGKLGLHYKVAPTFSIGLTYHSETSLSDLETSVGGATFSPMGTGKVTIRDFEWPETYAVGFAWQATPKLMLAADAKRVEWSETMETFKMVFSSGGMDVPLNMPLNWDDQNVFSVGLQYQASDALGLRIGYNYGKNPVPSSTLNPLFPAIVEQHFTAGFDYRFDKHNCLAAAISYAPEVEQASGPMTVTHSQVSAMVGFNHRF